MHSVIRIPGALVRLLQKNRTAECVYVCRKIYRYRYRYLFLRNWPNDHRGLVSPKPDGVVLSGCRLREVLQFESKGSVLAESLLPGRGFTSVLLKPSAS